MYFREASAPAPGGGLYYVDRTSNRLYVLDPPSERKPLGKVPGFEPLALAAAGSTLIVGSELGLYESFDGGISFTRAEGVRGLHFTAVALEGEDALAADWGSALWYSHDGGRSWTKAAAPASDLQVNSVLISPAAWYAATWTGLLRSVDAGSTWEMLPAGLDRLTSLYLDGSDLLLATWDGKLLSSPDHGTTWSLERRFTSGVWWLGGPGLVGTATGLYVDGIRAPAPLSDSEVIQVRRSGPNLFAVQPANAPVVWADLAGSGWRKLPSH